MPGTCECGCGGRTNIASHSNRALGHIKGQPVRFISGHNRRKARDADYIREDRGWKTPCLVWQGTITDSGYGELSRRGIRKKAHVWFWEAIHGPVPDGLELDHLCRVRRCVNVEHLEPVTHAENMRRSILATPASVRQAILRSTGSSRTVASRVGVSHTTVLAIRRAAM